MEVCINMKHRLPLFVAGTATVLASFGAVAQSASATPVPERGQTWLSVPVAQGQTWLSPTAAANKWFSPLAGHSFLGGLIHLPGNYGTGPVMPPLF